MLLLAWHLLLLVRHMLVAMPLPNASKQELFLRSVATSRLDHAVTRALRPFGPPPNLR